MPSVKWNVILKRPLTTLKILSLGTWRSAVVLLARIVLPFRARKLTFRNALARIWIMTANAEDPDTMCSEPWGHRCQEVELVGDSNHHKSKVGGWVIPTTDVSELKNKDAIILFAHGGGYALGHGLQDLTMFRRLVRKAKMMGQNMAFVSVKYRELSTLPCSGCQGVTCLLVHEC